MSDPTSGVMSPYGRRAPAARDSGGNLGDILERVLDRGVVIVGDIRVNLLDIELLTIKLRLLIASVDTARELGIDWWEHDPWLSSKDRDLIEENRRLRRRLATIEEEDAARGRPTIEGPRREQAFDDRELRSYEERERREPRGYDEGERRTQGGRERRG
ncbi:hypothetical protein Ssi03_54660 [Sphaerisporangium siamense]|uniref:Gas vesicle structural protein n=1 Tax=Sphaerisporangium siamense TaxID=795645 RepID=A0A7W7DAZ2_9ACTN|nr:hypothetical protein [Sphaerisporangium siamense]GII87476.1 hypothetical protein Ssi03_54660 [Sphaerisporangium siamense]